MTQSSRKLFNGGAQLAQWPARAILLSGQVCLQRPNGQRVITGLWWADPHWCPTCGEALAIEVLGLFTFLALKLFLDTVWHPTSGCCMRLRDWDDCHSSFQLLWRSHQVSSGSEIAPEKKKWVDTLAIQDPLNDNRKPIGWGGSESLLSTYHFLWLIMGCDDRLRRCRTMAQKIGREMLCMVEPFYMLHL